MITAGELRSIPLFATLPDDEAETLTARLADIHLRAGDWLLHEGEQPSFFMLIDGSIQEHPLTADFNISLIGAPGTAHSPLKLEPAPSELLGIPDHPT